MSRLGANAEPLIAVLLIVVVLVTGWSTISRVRTLIEWDATFAGSGAFTAVACESESVLGPDRWRCQGRLVPATALDAPTAVERPATLIVGKGARLSARPYVGQQFDVYYADESVGPESAEENGPIVYADAYQLAELSRHYLRLLPQMMVLVGAMGWLLGFVIDRLAARSSASDWRRSTLFSGLRRRGALWAAAGVVAFVPYYLVVRFVLGSAGAS